MRAALLCPALAIVCLAQPAPSPAGSWKGSIQIPGQELEVLITLSEKPAWSGQISIPAQGLRDFRLAVTVEGAAVTLRMAIPGDPVFRGTLKEDVLSGTFNQSGMAFPFSLKRTAAAVPALPAAPEGVTERAVQVGQAPWALPGTLAVPRGKGPFPVLVLVHGSGPNDRDERVGQCAPFRDLAWGLAQRGVMVLRYDKRTKVHPQACAALAGLTVKEEVVEDAAQAVILAGQQPEAGKVFLLGHSLGGYLLPRLAKAAPSCAGYISMAGCARPLEELMLEQLKRQGAPADVMASVEEGVKRIHTLDPAKPEPGNILNCPASYWMDLRGYAPAREAQVIRKPMLFLQGDKDCQVTLEDFHIWRKSLEVRPDATFKRYANLNHLFVAVEGASTGAEYFQPGRVDTAVLEDLAGWIKKN